LGAGGPEFKSRRPDTYFLFSMNCPRYLQAQKPNLVKIASVAPRVQTISSGPRACTNFATVSLASHTGSLIFGGPACAALCGFASCRGRLKFRERVDDRPRRLGRCSFVEVDQAVSVDLFAQHRELIAQAPSLESRYIL